MPDLYLLKSPQILTHNFCQRAALYRICNHCARDFSPFRGQDYIGDYRFNIFLDFAAFVCRNAVLHYVQALNRQRAAAKQYDGALTMAAPYEAYAAPLNFLH